MDTVRPSPSISIARERANTFDAILLISELEAHLDPLYPRASRHGLSVDQLLAERVAFFVLRLDGLPAGCGGVKLCEEGYGEAKRMYVRPAYRGIGLATLILEHLAKYARAQRVSHLRLETGIHQREAIRLYERCGFRRIAPFGPYTDDPLSLYFEKALA